MSETKRFPLRVLLSVTTRLLLTAPKGDHDNGIGDMYELLGWMTGDTPFTHQLPRFAEECSPWLRRWFPELFTVSVRELNEELDATDRLPLASRDAARAGVIENWLAALVPKLGADFDVPRIPADDHIRKDPIDEMVEMRGTDEGIVVVKVGDDQK
jgi:hypothetical protein